MVARYAASTRAERALVAARALSPVDRFGRLVSSSQVGLVTLAHDEQAPQVGLAEDGRWHFRETRRFHPGHWAVVDITLFEKPAKERLAV
jgi:hypothetical protein